MNPYRIGVQLGSFHQPWRAALESAARAGAQGVEIEARGDFSPRTLSDTAVRQIRKTVADFNLQIAAVRFRTRRGYDVLDELEPRIRATRETMELAYKLGTGTVVNQIGTVPDDPSDQRWQVLVESLTDLARHGQRVGAMLTAETGSESGPKLLSLINALPPGSLPLAFNPGNLLIQGFDPGEALRTLGSYVTYVEARDATLDRSRGRGIDVPLGRGSIDFLELLATLGEYQYRGYVTIDREGMTGPASEVVAGVQYLRELMDN